MKPTQQFQGKGKYPLDEPPANHRIIQSTDMTLTRSDMQVLCEKHGTEYAQKILTAMAKTPFGVYIVQIPYFANKEMHPSFHKILAYIMCRERKHSNAYLITTIQESRKLIAHSIVGLTSLHRFEKSVSMSIQDEFSQLRIEIYESVNDRDRLVRPVPPIVLGNLSGTHVYRMIYYQQEFELIDGSEGFADPVVVDIVRQISPQDFAEVISDTKIYLSGRESVQPNFAFPIEKLNQDIRSLESDKRTYEKELEKTIGDIQLLFQPWSAGKKLPDQEKIQSLTTDQTQLIGKIAECDQMISDLQEKIARGRQIEESHAEQARKHKIAEIQSAIKTASDDYEQALTDYLRLKQAAEKAQMDADGAYALMVQKEILLGDLKEDLKNI